MKRRHVLVRCTALAGLAGLFVTFGAAQDPKIDPEQRYLLLATSSTDTMQAELDKAATRGFRIVIGTSRGNSEVVLLLERDPKYAEEKYRYKLLATTDTITFEREVAEAARQGYRVVPRTFIVKPHVMSVTEIVVIMERPAKPEKRYEYHLLATTLTATLEKEWAEARSRQFVPVGMLTRAEVMVLLEREAKTQG